MKSLLLFVSNAYALQFLLNTNEPVCMEITPNSFDAGMQVSYTVTGMNEDQVTFTASQNKQVIETVTGKKDSHITVQNKGKAPVELCWSKLDRKSKKVNFMVH